MNTLRRALLCLVLVVVLQSPLGSAPGRPARAGAQSPSAAPSVADLLLPGGTLDLTTGFAGSLDPAGYELVSGPGEAPRFAPAGIEAADDERWAAGFHCPGATISVYALAVSGSTLYVGGNFSAIGGTLVNNIAKWDGSAWSALGSGTSGTVQALALDGSGSLYVGGSFSQAGGISAKCIARWDLLAGTWSALGTGMNMAVTALAVSGGTLYAGGQFTSPAGYVAQWDGSAWSALGSGMNGQVYALVVDGSGNLYAGGTFTTPVSYIAKWSGGAWSALGTGPNNAVYALVGSGGMLYAGGQFTTAGGGAANRVARWDGSAWSALGTGVGSYVYALAVSDSTLYAGGNFTTAGGSPASYVAQWNGANWSVLGSGVDNMVSTLAVSGGSLVAGGAFTVAGGVGATHLALWNGSAWSALTTGNGMGNTVYTLVASGSTLYAGGLFSAAGGAAASRIAAWDGSAWSALGSGVSSTVYALAASGSTLFAGGDFTTAGGITVNRVARWDGSAWSALGGGMGSTVYALAVDGSGNLYAGGAFTSPANYVAMWNGGTWSALDTGTNGTVRALAVSGGILYAGGEFTTAGGITVNRVARWDGTAWSALGSGMSSTVHALAVDGDGKLWAGGQFTSPASYVAAWNGTAWSALGSGTNSYVRVLLPDGAGGIYAGGDFLTAGLAQVYRTAHWDGSTWGGLGSGTDSTVYAVSSIGGFLYAGGNFRTAGGKISSNIGRWQPTLYSGIWDPIGYCMDAPYTANTGHVGRCSGEYIWTDAAGDQRTDGDDPDGNYDLTRLRLAGDAAGLNLLLTLSDITDTSRPYIAVAVDTTLDADGQGWLGDFSDTQVSGSARWEREIVANLNKTGYYDASWAWTNAGSSYLWPVDNVVEIRMPWSALGVTLPAKLRFTVMVAQNSGGSTREIGDGSISDALDAVTWTSGNTWSEVGDGVIDYYFDVWFKSSGEVYSPLLITGVLADGPGNPECEWVELNNVAELPVNLLNYKLGDEETKGGNEGMKVLPSLNWERGTLVIASNLATCLCDFAATYEFSALATYPAWGTGSVALANSSDEVLLLDDRDTVLDVVVFGGSYPGVNSHPALVESHWLDRTPDATDTNNCAMDFVDSLGPCPPAPTSVDLERFEGWPEGASIHMQWETSQEIDNLGFNLYRSNTRGGERLKLNAGLIPTLVPPGSPFGAVYDWIDGYRLRPGRAYFYWLEAVDLYGGVQLFGPERVRAGR